MTAEEALNHYHLPLVRIKRHKGNKHFHKGILVGVEGEYALVKPFGHGGRIERIRKDGVALWTSQNEQNEQRLAQLHFTPYKLNDLAAAPKNEDAATELLLKQALNPTTLTKDWFQHHTAEMESALWDILSEQEPSFQQRLLSGDAGSLIRLVLIERRANFSRFAATVSAETGQAISVKHLEKLVSSFAKAVARRPVAEVFPVLVDCIQPPPAIAAPVTPPEATIIPIAEAPADEPPSAPASVSEPDQPAALTPHELQLALRRVIRDSDRVADDRRHALEAAVIGEPQLNPALDALGIDADVAEVLTIQGINASADDVRQARAELWPVPVKVPAPVPAIDVLRAALASGELSAVDVLRALLGTPGIANPTQLARRCVNLDLDRFALDA